jgi:hypothetical protein
MVRAAARNRWCSSRYRPVRWRRDRRWSHPARQARSRRGNRSYGHYQRRRPVLLWCDWLLRSRCIRHRSRTTGNGTDPAIRRIDAAHPVRRCGCDRAACCRSRAEGGPPGAYTAGCRGPLVGIGFTNLLHLYSPDMIIMGGGISHAFDLLHEVILSTVRNRAMKAYKDVPIVAAQLGRHAGAKEADTLFDLVRQFKIGIDILPSSRVPCRPVRRLRGRCLLPPAK